MSDSLLSIVLSVASAAVFAVATILQHRAAAAVPTEGVGPIRLIGRLVGQPRWLVGKVGDVLGFVLHAAALAVGSFIVVQAIMSVGVVMTLLLEARLDHRRLAVATWVGSITLLLGIAMLVGIGDPGGGRDVAPVPTSLTVSIVTAALMLGALYFTRNGTGSWIGVLLATAGGVGFALDAAFVRTAGHLLGDEGISGHVVYAACGFVVTAIAGNVLVQRAFQISSLRVSLPGLTAVQPLASVVFGYLLFNERFASNGRVGGFLGIVFLVAGVVITQIDMTPTDPLTHAVS